MGLHQRRERQGQGGLAGALITPGLISTGEGAQIAHQPIALLQLHRHQPIGTGRPQIQPRIQQGPGHPQSQRRCQARGHGRNQPGSFPS